MFALNAESALLIISFSVLYSLGRGFSNHLEFLNERGGGLSEGRTAIQSIR